MAGAQVRARAASKMSLHSRVRHLEAAVQLQPEKSAGHSVWRVRSRVCLHLQHNQPIQLNHALLPVRARSHPGRRITCKFLAACFFFFFFFSKKIFF